MRRFSGQAVYVGTATAFAAALVPEAFAQLSAQDMDRLAAQLPPPAKRPVDFDREIPPIFEKHCIQCHGAERPKSRFRLTSRDEALRGGADGVDIVPGKSAASPLIYYVANVVNDMKMPPVGKGDPLSPEEVALLRAWIDAGASWGGATNRPPQMAFSVTPKLQFFTVKGNEQKFREHTGLREGFGGGVESLFFQEQSGKTKLTFEGRTLANPDEYQYKLKLEQRDLGYAQFGFEQYREYYSDAGGHYPGFDPSAYSLRRDLHLDIGRAWADFVLTLPDKPRILLGYEYQYRSGTKSLLQWGDVGSISPNEDLFNTDARKIYPSPQEIDERVHIVKFDVTHEVNGIGFENNFRGEFFDNRTAREGTDFFNTKTQTQEKYVVTREHENQFQASDAFRVEKQVLDWLFLSGGYYFSRLEGDYSLNTQTVSPIGLYTGNDPFWFTDSITLEQNTHVLNANTQLGPWSGLTIFAGAQGEWMNQRGFGNVRLDEGIPGSIAPVPASVDSNLDRAVVDEHIGFRYTSIPYTVVFAEARLEQESIGQYEDQVGGAHEFLRDTDATSDLEEARVGFTLSPWTRASLTAQYKRRLKDSDYNHLRDEQFGARNDGYSAFITRRSTDTSDLSLKLALRPANWLKATLSYQRLATDYETATDSIILPELNIPGLPPIPAEVLAPGGSLWAGRYQADVYGVNFTVAPWARVTLASSFSYRTSRSTTWLSGLSGVVPYEGKMFTSRSTIHYTLNDKTDLTGTYSYSWADYSQNNFSSGLPLGLNYNWHTASAAVRRRLSHNVSTSLEYRFYYYDESNTSGLNNYVAHGLIATMTVSL